MQTSIYTQMEISGKTEEIMKAIEVIMDYQCKTHRAKYYFANGIITVNNSRMELQAELISEYLKNTEGTIQGAITIEMDGPYGEFYSLREIDFFEKIADEIPAITLKGSFIEEGTYSYETVEAQLINMRLHVSKYYENFEVIDDNYLKMVRKKLPHNKFIELLGLDTDGFGEDEYNGFISEASGRDHFLFDHYYEFSDFFPLLNISKSQYDDLSNSLAKMGIDYCVYRESRECGDLINYTYDPIKHRYYEDENSAISNEMRDTPGNIYTGSIQACPFSITINGVFIETNTSLEDLKDAGLTEDPLCIDKYENIYEYAVNRPVSIQGLRFYVIFKFVIEENESRFGGFELVIDSNIDGKQKWTKAYIFARNTFGGPNTERISEVTFQDGNADIYWDYDPRNGGESGELVPIISYREPSEDEEVLFCSE